MKEFIAIETVTGIVQVLTGAAVGVSGGPLESMEKRLQELWGNVRAYLGHSDTEYG